MARRSSARLRERSTTPKRVSLSHDAPTRTPRTLPAKLSSLQESDEMPGTFPQSESPSLMETEEPTTRTPTRAAIKPSAEEMHPQLHHQSTAKPREEARHLGFSNMAPQTEPPQQKSRLATLQGTPTRNFEKDLKSPSYEFTFRREHSLELSPEAKQLMYEKREEAAAIKKQMIADGAGVQSIDEVIARKKAVPSGRYSQVHMKEFSKMGSIANHPSAFRADPNRLKPSVASSAAPASGKSLKRSPSKAELDTADRAPSRPSSRDAPKAAPIFKGSTLPRSTSKVDLKAAEASSPAKRVKRAAHEDVSATRPVSSEEEKPLPSTPNTQRKQPSYPDLTHLTTPTQSSLSRAASIKSTKTSKIPGPQHTPAKAPAESAHKQPIRPQDHSTPLLHRSPSKPSFFTKPNVETSEVEKRNGEKPKSMMDPQLARTPAKSGFLKRTIGREDQAGSPREKPAPLLSRSPVKAAVTKAGETVPAEEKAAPVPFLSRSPSKIPMTGNPFSTTAPSAETPGKSMSTKLLGRFNLLRQSPMKSILRSPQRLYSDDPSKVAAGTHMATPPKNKTKVDPPSTVPVRKHVDFSSSTKACESKAASATPSSPTKTPERSAKSVRTVSMVPTVDYPALPREDRLLSPSPQKRRETAGPGDFTFRADDHGIVFARSPNAPASEKKRPSTIRFIPSEQPPAPPASTGSKKRKHEFEDRAVVEAEMSSMSDKENTSADEQDERPAKRMKASAPSPVKRVEVKKVDEKKTMEKKRPTLGVKPKGVKTAPPTSGATKEKKPGGTTISQARLNALSQPKRR